MKEYILPDDTYRFMRDPIFGREGWCVATSLIQAMQTMPWVMKEIGHIKGKVGDTLVIKNHKLESTQQGGDK